MLLSYRYKSRRSWLKFIFRHISIKSIKLEITQRGDNILEQLNININKVKLTSDTTTSWPITFLYFFLLSLFRLITTWSLSWQNWNDSHRRILLELVWSLSISRREHFLLTNPRRCCYHKSRNPSIVNIDIELLKLNSRRSAYYCEKGCIL